MTPIDRSITHYGAFWAERADRLELLLNVNPMESTIITDNTAREQHESISFEFNLPHSPKKVWRALSDPVLLSEWLLSVTGLELMPGAAFTFVVQGPRWNGTVNCRILEVETYKKLSYTWVVGDDREIDTVVTFTLTPTASGTRLSLVHSGFKPHQKGAFGGQRYGWKTTGEKLIDLLERLS